MKKYAFTLLGLIILSLAVTVGINYVNDESGVFQTDFSQYRPVEPNQHLVKMRYLKENPHKYNAFCFGSSRVGNIDLKQIDNGLKYYNMTYSEGLPHEWLNDIKFLLKNKVEVKQLLIGLDDNSFRIDPEIHKNQLLRLPYDEYDIRPYFALLLRKPHFAEKLDDTTIGKSSLYDIYDSGRPLHPIPDEIIEQYTDVHLQNEKFKESSHYEGNRIAETMQDIREIVQLSKENNIELIFFFNPVQYLTYTSNNLTEFNEFKRQVAKLSDYYDFSGLNAITTNNYYYYETSHYRPLVGDMIVKRIFTMPKEEAADFGAYVTKDNVEEHIKNLAKEVENFK